MGTRFNQQSLITCIILSLTSIILAGEPVSSENPGAHGPIAFHPAQLIVPGIFCAVLLLFAGYLLVRDWSGGCLFELTAGLLAAGLGCYLGLGAQLLYVSGGELPMFGNGYENPMWVGGVCGGVFGFIAGVWYAQFLRRLLSNGCQAGGLIGKGVLAGIVLGVLCSTVVHVNLMAAYKNMHFARS